MSKSRWLGVGLALCLAAGPARATDTPDEEVIQIRTPNTRIEVVAVAPRLINEGLVDTTVAKGSSSGLPVVGVGEQVYVAAAVGGLKSVTAFNWTLTPPSGSSVTLTDAPQIGKTFTPDVAGDYAVALTMTHAGGDTTLNRTITAATYVGVDRCGQCHPGMKESWSQTKHATALTKKISGFQTGSFQARCISCHSASSNTSNISVAAPDNGSFWDVARDLGWTFPSDLTQGTWVEASGQTTGPVSFTNGAWNLDLQNSVWSQMSDSLKVMGNITCEACHGPGSAHVSGGMAGPPGQKKIGVSIDGGVCARCHDDGHYHVRPEEWAHSAHGRVWSRSSTSCSVCHLGSGFLAALEQNLDASDSGQTPPASALEVGLSQTCATCHDPHSRANEHQVRISGTTTIEALVPGQGNTPVSYTADLGRGALCAECHNLRPGRNEPGTSIHHSHQTEMLLGIGGYHYDGETYPSGGHKFMDNSCAQCHMAIPPRGSAAAGKVGSHAWHMRSDNGTPDDASDDIFFTQPCANCHGPIENFNVNGAQTEIEEMLHVLGDLLPKVEGEPTEVATYYSPGGHGSATREMTQVEINAAWNHRFVEADGSEGVHNFVYARKLVADALKEMSPTVTPAPMAGDFNNDNKVDFTDLFLFTANFGKGPGSEGWDERFDLSGNGAVGFSDWLIFLDNFGKSSAATKPVMVNNGRNMQGDFALVGSNRKSIDQDHLGVTLKALNMTEMRGYGVYVSYDPNVLEFVRAIRADGNILPESKTALAVQSLEPGRVLIADATSGEQAASGSGPVADLIFRRIGAADQSSVQIDLAQIADLNLGVNMPGAPAQEVAAPVVYALNQNFPNPFNPATTIRYSLASPGEVNIVVYNTLGQVVRTLVSNYKLAGEYTAQWDARDNAGQEVASGVYVYRMEVNGFAQTQRMVLMR